MGQHGQRLLTAMLSSRKILPRQEPNGILLTNSAGGSLTCKERGILSTRDLGFPSLLMDKLVKLLFPGIPTGDPDSRLLR
jgi:hypothetical protein